MKEKKKSVIIGLSIALGITSLATIGFGVMSGINLNTKDKYGTQLENVYKKKYV